MHTAKEDPQELADTCDECKGSWSWRWVTERAQHLWVLQECRLVVRAASAAVQQRLGVFGPAPKVHLLVPRLVNTDHRCIDQTADIRVCEELAPVCEGHPADFKENAVRGPKEEKTVFKKKV